MITLAQYLLAIYLQEHESSDEPVYIEDEHPFSGLIEEE